MPLTPKGYCDFAKPGLAFFDEHAQLAEMPLTPKGYCDTSVKVDSVHDFPGQKCP